MRRGDRKTDLDDLGCDCPVSQPQSVFSWRSSFSFISNRSKQDFQKGLVVLLNIYSERILGILLSTIVSSSSLGFSQDLVLDDLVLDLNADTGLTVEDGDKVTTWTNQAPNPQAVDFNATEEGRTKTIITQKEPGTGRPTLKKNIREINAHNSLVVREDELINDRPEPSISPVAPHGEKHHFGM